MKKIKILLTGANGQLGLSLVHLPALTDKVLWISTDFQELDITNDLAVNEFIRINAPDYLINCAAYTAVNQAEKEYDKAYQINAIGAENLATAAKSAGIPLIHISTDYVFSGQTCKPYCETDLPDPKSVYGKTKLAGEQAILRIGGPAIIIRTSWLYSEFGNNFVLTMMNLGKSKESIGVVADQTGSPTYAGDLAAALMEVIDYDVQHPGWLTQPEVFHFCNTGIASWFDLAKAIMELADLPCQVNPLSTEEYPSIAPRPAFSVLDTKKFRTFFGAEIPYWRTSVNLCIQKLRPWERQK